MLLVLCCFCGVGHCCLLLYLVFFCWFFVRVGLVFLYVSVFVGAAAVLGSLCGQWLLWCSVFGVLFFVVG